MKRLAILAVVGGAFALPAAAQTVDTRAGAQAIAVAGGGGGPGRFEGSYTVRNTPDPAGLMGSSVHPCGLPSGLSATGPGFGVAGLLTTTGAGCERRATAAAWLALGDRDMARAVMMLDPISREAAATLPQPAPMASVAFRAPAPAPAPARPAYCAVPGIQNSECR